MTVSRFFPSVCPQNSGITSVKRKVRDFVRFSEGGRLKCPSISLSVCLSVILTSLSMCLSGLCLSADLGGSLPVVYRYSKERTLAWLRKKVEALADTLAEEKVYVGKGSQSSMLVKSRKESQGTKGQLYLSVSDTYSKQLSLLEEFLQFACGIIEDYLNKDLAKELINRCVITFS